MKFKDDLQRYLYYKGQADYCWWVLHEILKVPEKSLSPLEIMVDKATGFSEAKNKELLKNVKSLLKTMARCQDKIGENSEPIKNVLLKINTL